MVLQQGAPMGQEGKFWPVEIWILSQPLCLQLSQQGSVAGHPGPCPQGTLQALTCGFNQMQGP